MMLTNDVFRARPLAMLPGRLSGLFGDFTPRAGSSFRLTRSKGYNGVPIWNDKGVAVIEICGALLSGQGGWGFPDVSFYEDIDAAFSIALSDASIRGIVLKIDSPGGVISGLFSLAERIYRARSRKPIISVVADEAYSAAYALACATSSIAVPASGGVGSIGTLMIYGTTHRALDAAGVDMTVFRAGKHKAELNGVEPLQDDAAKRAQSQIDTLGEMFIAFVSKCRKLTVEKIRATEAETFLGQEGVELGLADHVMMPDEALAQFREAVLI